MKKNRASFLHKSGHLQYDDAIFNSKDFLRCFHEVSVLGLALLEGLRFALMAFP